MSRGRRGGAWRRAARRAGGLARAASGSGGCRRRSARRCGRSGALVPCRVGRRAARASGRSSPRCARAVPARVVLVTTLTRTGLALARELPEVDVATLLPLDAPRHRAARFLDGLALEAFCFTETEIWPTLLAELAARGVAGVHGERPRERAHGGARALAPSALRRARSRRSTCCMQSDERRGAHHRARRRSGARARGRQPQVRARRRARRPTSVARSRPGWAAAGAGRGQHARGRGGGRCSTPTRARRATIRACAPAPRPAASRAPRRRRRRWCATAAAAARPYARSRPARRRCRDGAPSCCSTSWARSRTATRSASPAFVGGSLVPIGGHNVLEPARAARPVLVGPHTGDAPRTPSMRLLAAGGGRRVRLDDELAVALARAARRSGARRARWAGARARRSPPARAPLARHLKIIAARLGPAPPARAAAGVMGGFAPRRARLGTAHRRPSARCGPASCRRPRPTAAWSGVRNALYDAGWLARHAGAGARGQRRQPDGRRHRQDADRALARGGARGARAARRDRRARLRQAAPRASSSSARRGAAGRRRRTAATRR